jgi:predicted O-linked N-acetylglucosamine transferase (SPINDLY family)
VPALSRKFQPPLQAKNRLANPEVQAKFQHGMALHQQGKFSEAECIYEDVLRQAPAHFDALHLLGVIALQSGNAQRGIDLIKKAIAINPRVAAAHSNLGRAFKELKRPSDAVASHNKAIALDPKYAEAYNSRGNALVDLKRFKEAVSNYDRAIALKPDYALAYYNRGIAFMDLGRAEDALASYDKTIALNPQSAEAYNNRGNALVNLKRYEEALVSCDRALALRREHPEAYNTRGNALRQLQRNPEALSSYSKAIELKPDYAEAYANRGNLLTEMKRREEALADYDKAITLKPDFAEAYTHRGNVLGELKRVDEALASYSRAMEIDPDHELLHGAWLHTKMRVCDWSDFDNQVAGLARKVERSAKVVPPFSFLALSDSLALQRTAAEALVAVEFPPSNSLPAIAKYPKLKKIRLGYFSADFREHAVAALVAELFERHDRSRFEVVAFSMGPDTRDDMHRRLKRTFDKFIDIQTQSDRDVALLARSFGVDIAIDLGGFTADSRTKIFAMRAAPIQVNYLGYPGTMGANYMDYLIADPVVIPESNRLHFTEKIVYLPNTYQANDRKRRIADKTFTRVATGLPQQGLVFCCFNNNHKITPEVFDCWMRILKQVDGSVLWLLEDNATAGRNLRREAERRGVSGERIVSADRAPHAEHLARQRLADLFLDTLPYNAHTTASDALWAGVPVLTCTGDAFAGRVAASLLNAIGLPELVTPTLQAYEALAVDLAIHPVKLGEIRRKLAANRLSTPLFDTPLFTRHVEEAYTSMCERYWADLPPDHIRVSP